MKIQDIDVVLSASELQDPTLRGGTSISSGSGRLQAGSKVGTGLSVQIFGMTFTSVPKGPGGEGSSDPTDILGPQQPTPIDEFPV